MSNRFTCRLGLLAGAATLGLALVAGAASAQDDITIGLVTKTDSNPFFAKMREGAQAKADELGVKLQAFAGKYDGDNESQVAAIENLISPGVKGILLTASDTKAIGPVVEQARAAGILVIALDTPLDPASTADATFATDNFKAGELIGQWAKGQLGDKAADTNVAFLDAHRDPADRRRRPRPGLHGRATASTRRTPPATSTRTTPASSATSGARARKRAAAPAWRRCSRRTRPSASSTPSTSRPRPAPTRR